MRVAIIGTRSPAPNKYEMLVEWSRILIEKRVEVSTGAADGCDNAAMVGASLVQDGDVISNLHVFLPWASYNRNRVPNGAHITVYDPKVHKEWTDSVWKYHPAAGNLTRGPFALHARNYGIVAHPQKVDVVIALPKSLHDHGGTGQGICVAKGLGIQVFNLLEASAVNDAAEWIDSL